MSLLPVLASVTTSPSDPKRCRLTATLRTLRDRYLSPVPIQENTWRTLISAITSKPKAVAKSRRDQAPPLSIRPRIGSAASAPTTPPLARKSSRSEPQPDASPAKWTNPDIDKLDSSAPNPIRHVLSASLSLNIS